MPPVTSAELPDTERSLTTSPREKAVHSTGSTNSRPGSPVEFLPAENPRWRWNAREQRWNVRYLGHNWTINQAEDSHVWFLADIHRVNLFVERSKRPQ